MCPAIFVPNTAAISTAVKHIYSRLSASAAELDQGIPDVMISMVSTTSTLGSEARNKLSQGLSRIVGQCGLWLVTSGEHSDPLACICASVVKSILPNSDNPSETLIIVANSNDVAFRAHSTSRRRTSAMTDTSMNTYYFVLNQNGVQQKQRLEFRSQAAIKLANPPPALLIGVPLDNIATSSSQTPGGTSLSPAIILPSSTKHDCRPLPIALFCGSTLTSIFELKNYIDCGVPCIVVQDSSDLCALLRTSHIFYRSANFAHETFITWLESELRAILADEADPDFSLEDAKAAICQSLSAALGDHSLLSFVTSSSLDCLPEHIAEQLMRSASCNEDYRQTLSLAVKLNVDSVTRSIKLGQLFNDEQFENLLVDALCHDSRMNVVDSLIDQYAHIHVTPRLLMKWLDQAVDLDFFNIVIVGQCLGYSEKLQTFTEEFSNDLDFMLYRTSGGFTNLFSADYFSQPSPSKDRAKSLQILALWALFLNRPELVKCLWAHSPEPLPLALIISRIAKSLAFEAREYFFYEQRLIELSKYLTTAACTLLDQAYKSSPRPAYQTLCRSLHNFNHVTLSRLAFETNSKEFISHECCQRWVLRLFYGNLQIGQILTVITLPRWLKIVLSAVFILPIRLWVSVRPPTTDLAQSTQWKHNGALQKPSSPTVALLESGRPTRRVRTSSTYSMHSSKSYAPVLRDETSAPSRDERNALNAQQLSSHFGAETPRSCIAPSHHIMNEETDALVTGNDTHRGGGSRNSPDLATRRQSTRKKNRVAGIGEFYSTPIVKYWLSLVFRLIYIFFLGYSVALPGCGNAIFDYVLWYWTLMWLVEDIWIIYNRFHYGNVSRLSWSLFDAICITVFLVLLIVFESSGQALSTILLIPCAYLVKVTWAALLLYQCYATLFIYIPLSDLLGPLMVRVKLMITRDFFNFLVMVFIVVISSAFAVKAVVYPDQNLTATVVKDSLSWAWMSLFTTDLSGLRQTEECRNSLLPSKSVEYCQSIGGYANPSCPVQGAASYFVIVEYLVILKLICWPLLFALFSKTAKEVDDEADQIWKYQLYGLATDFSLRPFLPPPFTPLFFLIISFCQLCACVSGTFAKASFTSADHPDTIHRSFDTVNDSPGKYSVVFKNPSVPSQKNDPTKHFYCRAALRYWKNQFSSVEAKLEKKLDNFIKETNERIHHLIVASNFTGTSAPNMEQKFESHTGNPKRLVVNQKYRSWDVLIPNYSPPHFSKPYQEFVPEMQKFVDHTSPHHLSELCKQWRQRKLNEILTSDRAYPLRLSGTGLPLNPFGRTGLAGRGNLAKFGPNNVQLYIIVAKAVDSKQLLILTTVDNDLPHQIRYDYNRADEFLGNMLTAVGLSDSNVQILSSKNHLVVGQVDHCVAHVCSEPLPSPDDTDNAWMEADVWAINLTANADHAILLQPKGDYAWKPLPVSFAQTQRNEFVSRCLRVLSISTG